MARRKSPKQRKEERQQEKRRSQQLWIVGVVVLFAVFAGIIFALTSLPADAPIPEGINQTYANFKTGTTDEGYPLLGEASAPYQVREFSSFSCPACADFHDSIFPQLLPFIERGQISFVFVPLQTGSIPNPEGAARTAICAGEQGKFWEMHDVLFSWHETFGNSAFQDSRIRTGVEALGMDTGAFNDCFRSNVTEGILNAAIAEGVGSTPSVFIDGVQIPNEELISNLQGRDYPANLVPGTLDDGTTETDGADTTEATEEPEEEPSEEPTETPDTSDESDSEEATDESATEDETESEVTETAPEPDTTEESE